MRTATPDDVTAAAAVLADAFFDDPIQVWLFPDEHKRPARLRRIFAGLLRHHLVGLDATYLSPAPDGSGVGAVAGWAPPSRWRMSWTTTARLALAHWSVLGARAGPGLRMLRQMEREHPAEPHWYLEVLGTAPAHQGKGLASAALTPVLSRCDTEGIPAYLESSKEANLAFYARHGFEVVGTVEVTGPPPVWRMWREPRPA